VLLLEQSIDKIVKSQIQMFSLVRNQLKSAKKALQEVDVFQSRPGFLGWSLEPAATLPVGNDIVERDTDYEMNAWNGLLNMAVPKSKISRSRKRMKLGQYLPKQIMWQRCNRCGEPKLPHRICEDHKDICALSDDDYEKHQKAVAQRAEEAEQ
jgi:ribosomal protein L32